VTFHISRVTVGQPVAVSKACAPIKRSAAAGRHPVAANTAL